MKGKNNSIKYKVMLVAYKDVEDNIKSSLNKYSVFHIVDKSFKSKNLNSNCGRSFNLNDRIQMYLGWFKDSILNSLEDGYVLDIIEIPKSYGDNQEIVLHELDEVYGDKVLVIDKIEI